MIYAVLTDRGFHSWHEDLDRAKQVADEWAGVVVGWPLIADMRRREVAAAVATMERALSELSIPPQRLWER